MRTYPQLEPDLACALLRDAGIDVCNDDLQMQRREERWMVHLAGGRVALFAATEAGVERIRREGELLRMLETHVSFQTPRVLFQSADASLEIRRKVIGRVDPFGMFRRILADRDLGSRIGHVLGEMLAELHSALPREQVRALLPERAPWPPSSDWIRERLPRAVSDRTLIDEIGVLLTEYDALDVADSDRVPVHGDLGLHNVVFHPDSAEVVGIFDFDGAAFADRHLDLRYLELHPEQPALPEAAIAAYQAITGRILSRQRLLLHNAASAFGYLAYRVGHAPEERWCGRTLDEDLGWCRHAISKLLGARS